jgi:hypothetical protein
VWHLNIEFKESVKMKNVKQINDSRDVLVFDGTDKVECFGGLKI